MSFRESGNYASRTDLQTDSAGSLINKNKGGRKMKRKLFLSGLILVLAAILAAPVMALADESGTTPVTGEVVAATISITAPSPIDLGPFVVGDMTGNSATPGTVKITAGTDPYPVVYSVSVKDSNTNPSTAGFMMNGTTPLSTKSTSKFMISPDGTPPTYVAADAGFNYTGSATNADPINLPFYVKQTIDGTETSGIYHITIKFTASLP
jgi:hypothetical protein